MELAVVHGDACGYSAAVARSLDNAVARLAANRNLTRKSAAMFGGTLIDMTGDSMLLTFDSARAAYASVRQMHETIAFEQQSNPEEAPFDFRFGVAKGNVRKIDGNLYGECINTAARIESLVAKGCVGVERKMWGEVQSLAAGRTSKPRAIFAKPDEPLVDFIEVGRISNGTSTLASTGDTYNAPSVLLNVRYLSPSEHAKNAAIEALSCSCQAIFSSRDWTCTTSIVKSDAGILLPSLADYNIFIMAIEVLSGFRLYARLSSPYIQRNDVTFSRDVLEAGDMASHVASLSSLLASAITHAEVERVGNMRHVGAHQLVTAGRDFISRLSLDDFVKGFGYLSKAFGIAPEYPFLLSSLGRAHAFAWRFGWNPDGVDLMEKAVQLTDDAISMANDDWRCQADLAFVKFWNNEPREAEWHYDRSLETLSFHPELAADAGMVYSFVGDNGKAEKILEHSIANLPNDADYRLWSLGDVCFSKRDYANSLKWISRMRDKSQAQRLFAANKARLGLDPSMHVRNVLARQPDFSVGRWVSIQPFTNEAERIDYEEALLAAGLPP